LLIPSPLAFAEGLFYLKIFYRRRRIFKRFVVLDNKVYINLIPIITNIVKFLTDAKEKKSVNRMAKHFLKRK